MVRNERIGEEVNDIDQLMKPCGSFGEGSSSVHMATFSSANVATGSDHDE
ncbi:hypothetical protein [Anoxybacillus gonensis]|nr:hypothetical protein [Anoxybacillus gonensis]EMI10213.1 hypothetical protein F510_1520 [Anoxybacillus gonensis]